MNKPIPNSVAQWMLQERRQNTELREKIDRLLKAARAVDDGGIVVDQGTCEVPLDDLNALRMALMEWGK